MYICIVLSLKFSDLHSLLSDIRNQLTFCFTVYIMVIFKYILCVIIIISITEILLKVALNTITLAHNCNPLYNYHPCWSVTRRFVSQRKVRSPKGLIIGILYQIFLHPTPSNRIPAALRKYSI